MGFKIDNGVLLRYQEEAGITEVVIPECVTSIGDKAFWFCENLTKIVIPKDVTSIGDDAFFRCKSLTSIVIPKGLTNVGEGAFYSCERLPDIIISEGVTSIPKGAFQYCKSLTNIDIPKSVTKIGDEAFYGCKNLTNIVIPESVSSIGDEAFFGCESLTRLVIPKNVRNIGDGAFARCKSLTSLVIPDHITSIPNSAFQWCESLTNLVIPKNVTNIGDGAFAGCKSLTSFVIPESVTNIGNSAFSWCSSLTNLVIPEGVANIGDEAFSGCSGLISLVIPEVVTRISNKVFSYCSSLSRIDIPKGVTDIGNGAFSGCSSLLSIIIPDCVTDIRESALSGCTSLTNIIIPDSVTNIGWGAFSGCSSLTSIVIPQTVSSIGGKAFENCNNLTSIFIPEGVTTIGRGTFSGCKELSSIIIPKSVKTIEAYAFQDCSSLTSIVIPEGVTSLEYQTFSGCSSLTSIVIPESVTSIGEGAFFGSGGSTFSGCSSLTSIIIPKSVTSIQDGLFQSCSSLKSIYFPESVTSIGKMVFEGCAELKEIHNILSLILKGCKIHVSTYTWLLENIWNGPEFLSETTQVYLTNPGKAVNEICESRLFENCAATADVMFELIKTNKDNASALKKIATFALTCGGELPREKLIAIYEALKEIGAKPAVKLLEKAVQSDGTPTLEGGTGHPIEAICLERYKEAIVDKGLKDYGISPKLFEGVRYKGSKTLAPAFVVKCAIYPYMQKLKELPRSIGGYATDFVELEPDSQIDQIADTLDREDLQALLGDLIFKFDPFKWRLLLPYCRYGSGKQMNALNPWAKKWAVWGDYDAAGRRFIIVLHGAMMLNENREAMFLLDKWGFLEEYAKRRNTTADVLRDTVLTEFDLDADGSKRYDLGNAVIAASIMQDLSVSLFNETDRKEVKSLPKKGADPEKYATASEDFADLKKNIKNAVKSRVEKLKEDFVSGRELKAADWKASYLNNYVLKRVASLLAWQWKLEESTMRFMLTMDGTFIGCNGQAVEISDTGSIALAHPVEIPAEELDCWKSLLTEKQLAQPFVQIFEPICDGDLSAAAARYRGIELPMFLLRGLAKEGIVVNFFDYEDYNKIWFNGQATEIVGNVVPAMYFSEKSIAFDAIVKLSDVTIKGKPRAVNHEIYAMDKALIENRVRNGDIAAVQAFSRAITAKTIQHLIDVSIQVEQMEVTAWLMNYKNDHFPYTFADLEL